MIFYPKHDIIKMDKRKEDRKMHQVITLKVRLKPTSQQAQAFEKVSETYRDACNVVSQWYFDHHFKMSRKDFNHKLYHPLRKQFPEMNSAMVQSTYRTIVARYDAVGTQIKQRSTYVPSGKVNAQGKEVWEPVKRDLDWLWNPIHFKRPQADYVRKLNYSFVQNASKISLNVLSKRIKVDFDKYYLETLLDPNVKLGTAKLVKACGKWYLHVSLTRVIPDLLKDSEIKRVVGIDRGLRFLVTAFDSKQQTRFVSGKQIVSKRRHYKALRAQLQQCKSSSARQRLKKIGHKENRWMSDVNHQLSKALIDYYGPETLFVLEDLTGVKQEVKHRKRENRYEQSSWAFYELEQDLEYKALANHCKVLKVPAQYTSQRCPRCGRINKANRDHQKHLYVCDRCSYQSNDDRIGAMNIYQLGLMVRNGDVQAKFIK